LTRDVSIESIEDWENVVEKYRKKVNMTNKIVKIKKGLKNNIISSLLLGSSIAITMQAQASQRLFLPSEKESTDLTEEGRTEIAAKLAKIDFPKKWEAVNRTRTDWAEIRNELAKIDPSSKWETVNLVEADWTEIRTKLANEEKRKKREKDSKQQHEKNQRFDRRLRAQTVQNTGNMARAAINHMHSMTYGR
jgi:hypothetical protein